AAAARAAQREVGASLMSKARLAAPGAGLHRFRHGTMARCALVVRIEDLAEFLNELAALNFLPVGGPARAFGLLASDGTTAMVLLHAGQRSEHRAGVGKSLLRCELHRPAQQREHCGVHSFFELTMSRRRPRER